MVKHWFFICLACFAVGTTAAQDDMGVQYTGTASYVSRTTGKGADNSSQYSASSWSSLVEYKMDATITKGKGTGSSSLVIRRQRTDSEWFSGEKTTGTKTETGNANGSAATELTLQLSDDGKSYSFFIYIPPCTGTLTTTYSAGQQGENAPMPVGQTREAGQDEGLIQVEYQPVKNGVEVLSGEIRERTDDGDGYTETILSWNFYRKPFEGELIITPVNYDSWLPAPGKDEASHGSSLKVGLLARGKGGKPLPVKVKSFKVSLENTSREPGISINYPLNPGEPLPDLRLLPSGGAQPDKDGQTIELPSADGKTGTVVIGAFDGGGYTTLRAEAILTNGHRITGTLLTPAGPAAILIPKRKEGSAIASSWLARYNDPGEQEDKDVSPGNNKQGDGLTVYEEYRGIVSKGKYLRLDPGKKELGVQVKETDLPIFHKGLQLVQAASGLVIIPLYENELPEGRIFNVNRGHASNGEQYALRLLNEDLTKYANTYKHKSTGMNFPFSDYGKGTRQSVKTVIDLAEMTAAYQEQLDSAKASNTRLPYTLEDEIANTVAHELLHGVNVSHHGTVPEEKPRPLTPAPKNGGKPPRVPVYAFGVDGHRWDALDGKPENERYVDGKIGRPQSDASGDMSCIMVYTTYYQWFIDLKPGVQVHYHSMPYLPYGKKLCTSATGTGLNANGKYFGDAERGAGNCLSQISVKSY
ncbi:MAG: hypothetical protein P0Y53_00615 [Candidatus Pseudobacter hemicellulosilyticus]|uniref:Uncharacterized protein n=1 Tax=Candidatus Pseudobacter hemicellulosilyticus TaxID=3121375 RepID=A0AAJ5WUP9_9BACT|nr:MAG: hypothetical protein P0Y53_00615 [Pseudobacter sp.]